MSEDDMVHAENWRKVVATKNCGLKLWAGSWYMTASHTITPAIPIAKCLNGWLLHFVEYRNGALWNANNNYVCIPKNHVTDAHGTGVGISLALPWDTASYKYLYVTGTTITGHANNDKATGNANKMMLTEVYGW